MLRLPGALLVWCIVVMSGCMRYQYATVSSDKQTTDANEFTTETDSARVSYRFQGVGGPVQIRIVNKLSVPLYVDWTRSSLVLNGRSTSFKKSTMHFDGEYSSDGYRFRDGSFSGDVVETESRSFIPSDTYGEWTQLQAKPDFFDIPADDKPDSVSIRTTMGRMPARQFLYDRDNSPLSIRSILTLSTSPEFDSAFTIESEFWVSSLVETTSSPASLRYGERSYDRFYNKKSTYVGESVLVATVVTVMVLMFSSFSQSTDF